MTSTCVIALIVHTPVQSTAIHPHSILYRSFAVTKITVD